MPEWIEFYALQGATRIVIGDHRSRDSLHALPALYRRRGAGFPIVEVFHNFGEQTPFLEWCGRRYRKSEWLLLCDNDEFFWSPRHGSLAAYLATLPRDVTQVLGFPVRFGVGRCAARQRLRVRADVGAIQLLRPARPPALYANSSPPWPLVIETHTRRPPHPRLGEARLLDAIRDSGLVRACNASAMRDAVGAAFTGMDPCDAADQLGKSFVRGYALGRLGHPHYWQLRKGLSHRETDLDELRFNHYWVRCRADAYAKARQWRKHDPVEWLEHAALLREAVADESLLFMVEPIKARLRAQIMQQGGEGGGAGGRGAGAGGALAAQQQQQRNATGARR